MKFIHPGTDRKYDVNHLRKRRKIYREKSNPPRSRLSLTRQRDVSSMVDRFGLEGYFFNAPLLGEKSG